MVALDRRRQGNPPRAHGRHAQTREQKAGRFLEPAAGTSVPNPPVRNNDDFNAANTAVMRIGTLVRLCEGGSAIELDPDSLETRGPMTWRDDLVAAPFSAHPLLERNGDAWNFGSLSFFGGAAWLSGTSAPTAS